MPRRERNYAAEYAARQARQQARTGESYGKARYQSERQSAQAQGFASPRAARKAGRKLSSGTKGARPPQRANVGRSQTIHRLIGPGDLGALRAALAGLPPGDSVIVVGSFKGRSGPVRVMWATDVDTIRSTSLAGIRDGLVAQAQADYGGRWTAPDLDPDSVQAVTRIVP